MTNFTLAVLLQLSVAAAGGDGYPEARQVSIRTGKPMVVMVGADWCSACVQMKRHVLPQIRRRGLLSKVAFAAVNLDRHRELGRRLTGGGPIPQLVMYRRTPNGWLRRRLVGAHNAAAVETFISRGISLDEESSKQRKAASQPNEQ